jgi:hypothetical protein
VAWKTRGGNSAGPSAGPASLAAKRAAADCGSSVLTAVAAATRSAMAASAAAATLLSLVLKQCAQSSPSREYDVTNLQPARPEPARHGDGFKPSRNRAHAC